MEIRTNLSVELHVFFTIATKKDFLKKIPNGKCEY